MERQSLVVGPSDSPVGKTVGFFWRGSEMQGIS